MRRTLFNESSPDSELVNELQGGSVVAFDLIFKKYYSNLCRFTYSAVKDADLSQSLVQDVFVKLWERRYISGKIRNLGAYLTMMVKNRIADYTHDRKNRDVLLQKISPEFSDENTEDEVLRRNFEECLVTALSKLPERCREAFELSRFDNLSNKEIAREMNISVKGVEALMGRSLKILRFELKEFLPSWQFKGGNMILFFVRILIRLKNR